MARAEHDTDTENDGKLAAAKFASVLQRICSNSDTLRSACALLH
jgi:hypothetical protein